MSQPMIKVAINGFGRIGRAFFRQVIDSTAIEVAAINDRADVNGLTYLLQYDSIHGKLAKRIEVTEGAIAIDGRQTVALCQTRKKGLPWKKLGIDVVLEATGGARTLSGAKKHLSSGAAKVLVTANPKKELIGSMPRYIWGVNDGIYQGEKVVSASSCSAVCAAPVVKLVHDAFNIEYATLTAVHAYTKDQRLLDSVHPADLRRGRAAALNIVPSDSDAASVISELIPGLEDKLMGSTIRIPVADGSLIELICKVRQPVTVETVNRLLRESADGDNRHILNYSDEPLVSRDIVGDPHAAIIDSLSTRVVRPSLVRIVHWYDHEWGYAARLIDTVKLMCSL